MSKNQKSKHTKPSIRRKRLSTVQKTILLVILANVALVIFCVVFVETHTPQNTVTSNLETIAKDYYENYFFPKLDASTETMDKYHQRGFSSVSLQHLLIYDGQKNAHLTNTFSDYCDLNRTTIKIYPDPPYTKDSYHIDYKYVCTY